LNATADSTAQHTKTSVRRPHHVQDRLWEAAPQLQGFCMHTVGRVRQMWLECTQA
jgi:hypothetical protein